MILNVTVHLYMIHKQKNPRDYLQNINIESIKYNITHYCKFPRNQFARSSESNTSQVCILPYKQLPQS